MSSSTSGPGGVKNLRAMFENKQPDNQADSPPSRGRSPNGSISSVQSRQLSKVRASFVAVERPGDIGQGTQWGLRKASDIESMDGLREETFMDGRNGGSGRDTTSSEGPGLGLILKGSPFESLTSTTPIQTSGAVKPAQSTTQPKKNGLPKPSGKPENVASMIQKLQNGNRAEASKKEDVDLSNNSKSSTKQQSKIAVKQQSPTATKSSPKIPVKTPTTPTPSNTNGPGFKPKGGVNKIKGVMESAEQAKQERQATASKETKAVPAANKATAASKESASAPTKAESPKDKDSARTAATRSTKLPSAAMQTTAAAAAKRESGAVTEPSKSKPTERKTTIPQAPKVASASTRASLAKKSSRPSLAPVSEKPKTRLSTASQATDDSFLSRMMRPTTSSAQKAHDKIQAPAPPHSKRTSLGGKELPKKTSRRVSNLPAQAHEKEGVNGGSEDADGADENTPPQQAEVEF